ncbi:ornithine carbamoyltransferase [Truepera radiovictrix]|uniref:Ornithine carbamoyltransferase n=1 Tax=Truepera radiovictrix (strain DSM 17093 / CIP 108686 / LMG 22925 / RQ-24) TaxID=649638 RepID=D7CX83_TRURR|nr:ornithine carbamoyltransferase [Truepera radiovictrix]ADI13207.1 ornithine carbamoyltransferase [Truepera radiovictrix DSM 17093]WMT58225.1 ornithine carbamoyltransferase [Truepera radiovictrix]
MSSPTIIESLRGRDLLALSDLTRDEFTGLLTSALELKRGWQAGERPALLKHQTLAMIFEKQSLRTRSTFDIAMYQLGGHSVLLSQNYIGWGVRETIKDVAHNLERWTQGIMARTYGHGTLLELAEHAGVPVINGLSDLLHPCQLTADYLTLKETFGDLEGLKIAFVGDGNNVCNSHLNAAALTGTSLTVACPEGFEPDAEVLAAARARGADITLVRDPREAAEGADVLYTDVWISMGQEEEAVRRREAFRGYTVTLEWLDGLSERGIFMHDLPAHYGEEVTEEVVYSPRSRVFDQAENRLHAHKAILFQLMRDG